MELINFAGCPNITLHWSKNKILFPGAFFKFTKIIRENLYIPLNDLLFILRNHKVSGPTVSRTYADFRGSIYCQCFIFILTFFGAPSFFRHQKDSGSWSIYNTENLFDVNWILVLCMHSQNLGFCYDLMPAHCVSVL